MLVAQGARFPISHGKQDAGREAIAPYRLAARYVSLFPHAGALGPPVSPT